MRTKTRLDGVIAGLLLIAHRKWSILNKTDSKRHAFGTKVGGIPYIPTQNTYGNTATVYCTPLAYPH